MFEEASSVLHPLKMDGNLKQTPQLCEKIILWASVGATLGLLQLPYQKIEGNVVPTIIFKNNPSYFRAFVLSISFSFFGSFMAIATRDRYPRPASCCSSLAMLSVIVGVAILAWLIMPGCVIRSLPK